MTIITDGKKLPGAAMPRILKGARAALEGKTIAKVGYVLEDWGDYTPVLQLSDGTILYIQRDDEGNGPGSACIQTSDGGEESLCQLS